MARTRKCPSCGSAVVNLRNTCPHCQASLAEGPRWDNPEQTSDKREAKLHAANVRMRNSGAVLFILGIITMSQGGSYPKLLSLGVVFIIVGTIVFLWGWKLLQAGK